MSVTNIPPCCLFIRKSKNNRDYWKKLEVDVKEYATSHEFPYVVNDLPYERSVPGHPVIVNYFYHEQIRLKK